MDPEAARLAETREWLTKAALDERGKRPHVDQGAYEPELVQLCLQALLLEEQGYRVEEGAIYYADGHERVRVVLDDELRAKARAAIDGLRRTVSEGTIPPPLEDSPKCPRCALVTVCLPDEVNLLRGSAITPRPIAVPADTALPLVVQSQHARIVKEGETLRVIDEDKVDSDMRLSFRFRGACASAPSKKTSQLVLTRPWHRRRTSAADRPW